MYNSILVITDNLYLAKMFEKIVLSNNNNFDIIFAISPFSSLEKYESVLHSNVYCYNLKNKNTIDKIIEKYEIVFSVHCKQLFPDKLVHNVKCINIHPGYNPINRGWYPQVFAIINNLPIGATIHEIDNELDHGNIIARKLVTKHIWDTSYSLYKKVIAAELELIEEYFEQIINNSYSTFIPENEGNIFYKKDFNNLCEINLEEKGSFLDFYNRLRALSHDKYYNAWFVDKDNNKVYINININIIKNNDSDSKLNNDK